jgi:hypothetical protein
MWQNIEIEQFEAELASNHLIATSLKDMVRNLFRPEEIFYTRELREWAENNLDLGDIAVPKQVIAKAWQPEDVFSDEKLCEWALARGFIKRIK